LYFFSLSCSNKPERAKKGNIRLLGNPENLPRRDYVVFFFLIAQLISWLVFKQIPSLTFAIGGMLIVAGGVVISMAKS
jgi:hypothetical protein